MVFPGKKKGGGVTSLMFVSQQLELTRPYFLTREDMSWVHGPRKKRK